MKSSKIENMFNFNPTLEETKTLSPLTYYQPFQSSFDPEFALTSGKNVNHAESQQIPMKRWRQGSGGQGIHISQAGALNLWDEKQNRGLGSKYLKDLQVAGSSSPAWTAGFNRRQMPLTTSLPNLLSIGPGRDWRQISGCMDDQTRKVSIDKDRNHGAWRSIQSKKYDIDPAYSMASGHSSGFGCFDGSSFDFGTSLGGQTSQVSPVEGSIHSSVYYPLTLSPFTKNTSSSKNSNKTGHSRPMVCNFCKNNKEVPDIYLNHYLHDPETKVLTCPVLRKHVCEICGGTGDGAHTLQYCPVNREKGLQAKVPVLLKTRTITNSTGKIRRN